MIHVSLAFLLVGMPIIFVFREYIAVDKSLLTNAIVILCILGVFNYRSFFMYKFYTKDSFFEGTIFFTLTFFLFHAILNFDITNKEVISIFAIFAIFLGILTNKSISISISENILIISSISVWISFLFTPTDFTYWLSHGGRFYVGDTKSPNLIGMMTGMNMITILLLHKIIKMKKKYFHILFIVTFFISLYLFVLSGNKSSYLGIALVLLYFIFLNGVRSIKPIILSLIFLSVIFIFISFINNDLIDKIAMIWGVLKNAYTSLIIGGNDNLSAQIRHENYSNGLKTFLYDFNILGHGMFTNRIDLPILQTFLDLGLLPGLLFVFSVFFLPLRLIFKSIKKIESSRIKLIKVIYMFMLPNYFLHGTPYEYITWLPILLLIVITRLELNYHQKKGVKNAK